MTGRDVGMGKDGEGVGRCGEGMGDGGEGEGGGERRGVCNGSGKWGEKSTINALNF